MDRFAEQAQAAVSLETPVVRIADTLSRIISFFWSMFSRAQSLSEDGGVRRALLDLCRPVCLWFLAVQHTFLDVHYYRVVHAEQQKLRERLRIRFCTVDYGLKMRGTRGRKI